MLGVLATLGSHQPIFRLGGAREAGSAASLLSLRGGAAAGTSADGGRDDHYDLIVVGGGSGGLACAKEAASLGARVLLFDFVRPSPQGSTWGLGGTCVNVGCIPKKLMHHAALIGQSFRDAEPYGWEVEPATHRWETMVEGVQDHIKSLNFGYRSELLEAGVEYRNAFAAFADERTVEAVDSKGRTSTVTADAFVISTGGRPSLPDIPGTQHVITSDDLFSLKSPPGDTLVVGASYVALECAGFIHGVGYPATVMMRSVPLRGFDQQMALLVKEDMEAEGVQFISGTPTAVERLRSGKKRVRWKRQDGSPAAAVYDTVLFATGRSACTRDLRLDKAGVTVNAAGKVGTTDERTNVPHIYAIGDVIDGAALQPPSSTTELTPVAIQAGRLLAARLYGGSDARMDYQGVPTTVYTPLEYGCVGLSEEEAVAAHGEENIEVYHSFFTPLEWKLTERSEANCYAKLVCDARDDLRVLGLHVCGPHAGEMTQGFAVALKCGATKADFDSTVGIHPTTVEELTTLSVTKRSGIAAQKRGC